MTYIDPQLLSFDNHKALVEWLKNEGLEAERVCNDGRFAVHNGRISGNEFVFDDEGNKILNRRSKVVLRRPFNVAQKNPLPEGLLDE